MKSNYSFIEFVELFITNFNQGTYDFMVENFAFDAELICPEVNSIFIKTPKTHIKGKNNIFTFWNKLSEVTSPEVTSIEYLEPACINKARFHYDQINLIMDAQFEFNNEYKITKLEFTIVS